MKSTRSLIDPDFHDLIDNFPRFELSDEIVPQLRIMERQMFGKLSEVRAGLKRVDISVPGLDGNPDVRCIQYSNPSATQPSPAFIQFHGGGLIIGSAEQADRRNSDVCETFGATIFAVDYRLAPENPFPAPIDDAYAVLTYVFENADQLGIDKTRISVGGESAGGGIAAMLAIRARNEGRYKICHQQLVYPMLDNETGLPGHKRSPDVGEFCWTREHNIYGWQAFLQGTKPSDALVPAKTADLKGLASVWMRIGDKDLFLEENQTYAKRLEKHGVSCDLEIYPNAPHGFYMALDAEISKQFEAEYIDALSIFWGAKT